MEIHDMPDMTPLVQKAPKWYLWVKDRPGDLEELQEDIVYLAGHPECARAVFVCPCGCKDRVELNIEPTQRRLQREVVAFELLRSQDERGEIYTISPSVVRRVGCKSQIYFGSAPVDSQSC